MKRAVRFPEHFDALIRHSPDAVFVAEPQGLRVVLANPRAAERVALPMDTLIGRSLVSHLSPEAMDIAGAALVRGKLAPPDPPMDAHLIRQDGRRVPVQFAANLDDAAGGCFLVISAREREQSIEQEKRRSRTEHLHHLLMQDPQSFTWSINAAMEITHISSSSQDVLGIRDVDLIGASVSHVLAPRSLDRLTAILNAHVLGDMSNEQRGPRAIDLEFVCHDGSTVLTETILSVYRRDTGELDGVIGLSRSARERKRLWNQREARMVAGFERDKADALRRMAAKCGEQIETTLRAIQRDASALEAELEPTSPAQHHVDRIVRTVRSATSMSRDLRRCSGTDLPKKMPISMNRILTGLGGLIQEIVPKSTIVKFELGENLPTFAADPAQMQEALLHLARNAAQSIGNRDGTITIRSSSVRVSPEDLTGYVTGARLRTGDYVFVDVVDDGDGIAGDRPENLFEPFYTTKPGSTGLGLSTVLGFARSHDAIIQLLSGSGRGTRFRILFPVLPTEKPGEALPELATAPATGKQILERRAIVVSTDSEVLKVCTGYFSRQGYGWSVAASVAHALKLLETSDTSVDVLVIDDDEIDADNHDRMRDLDGSGALPKMIVCYSRMPDSVLLADESHNHPAYISKPICATDLGTALRVLEDQMYGWLPTPGSHATAQQRR